MTIRVVDDADPTVTIAEFRLTSGYLIKSNRVVPASRGRDLMSALRSIPSCLVNVTAFYPMVGNSVSFNDESRLIGEFMDIDKVVAAREARAMADEPTRKSIFVAPLPDVIPNDGVLIYVTVETVFDIKTVPENGVALFSKDAYSALECVNENQVLFGVELQYLSGLPGVDYSHGFDSAAYALDRFSYATLTADLQHAAHTAAMLREQSASVHDKEVARISKSDGTVKAVGEDRLGDVGSEDDSDLETFRL